MQNQELSQTELQQEYYLLEGINNSLKEQIKNLLDLKSELEQKLENKDKSLLEVAQEKTLLNRINQRLEKQLPSKRQTNEDIDDDYSRTFDILKLFKSISLTRLKQLTGLDDSEIQAIISRLEKENKTKRISNITEPCCPECNYLLIESLFCCPKCNGTEHHKTNILEHYDCGNVSAESDYVDDKCPTCNKQLQALGVDYKKLPSKYSCKECENLFSNLKLFFKCTQCKAKFTIDDANWIESRGYKIILE